MKGILTEKTERFSFDENAFTETGTIGADGFVCKVRLRALPQKDEVLFQRGGFTLSFVRKTRETLTQTQTADRIWKFADESGRVALLEMKARFVSPYHEPREMISDLALPLFDAVKEPAYFVYDGVRFVWIFDGEVVNGDFPYGTPVPSQEERVSDFLAEWGVAPLSAVRKQSVYKESERNMAFYSPRGYNRWAGDVVNFYKDGVYRLIYFHDRHHHASRWGGGAHTMYQITTRDFVRWQESGALIELDENWKSVGTGTMFFHDGKYYYSYGLHTSRMIPQEFTGSKLLQEKIKDGAVYGAPYKEIYQRGLTPAGANFVYSEDGVNFRPGEYQFHVAENPSVYAEEDGTLTMYAGYGGSGAWKANKIEGPWRKAEGEFNMANSPLKPSTECPSRFELNGYAYLLVGGTGFWQTEKHGKLFYDAAKEGYDIYDGAFVPMVTKTDDGRLIYGGWVRGYGWASFIVHRELVQAENGRLYMKWLPELAPKEEELEQVDGFALDERTSYYFEAKIIPSENAKLVLRFEGEQDDALVLDSKTERVQISAVAKDEREPAEILPLYEQVKRGVEFSSRPDIFGDFSLGRVEHIKHEYTLRVIVYYEKKFDAVVIDAEIGGKRTLVSNRVDKRFRALSWTAENAAVENPRLYKFK